MQRNIYFKVVDLEQAKGGWFLKSLEKIVDRRLVAQLLDLSRSEIFRQSVCLEHKFGILELRESGKAVKLDLVVDLYYTYDNMF